ncbi:MAG: hypothetical protein JETT_1380 [Candidatus Jettenia ecosi]|uniref:Uncharacterized protein n=1 Tax=Candidatus Jettenia ecosi TaxID=2494326 RepID=A0A533QCB4_9BACT|nr:MAG: hypothetical protein JETT_1380 [Candidatus Jettenia ecosi]
MGRVKRSTGKDSLTAEVFFSEYLCSKAFLLLIQCIGISMFLL